MSRIVVAQEEHTAWWNNRKFIVPLFAALATIIVLFAQEAVPSFDVPQTLLAEILSAVWFLIVPLIVGGDIAYDNLRQLLLLLVELLDSRQPPAVG